MSDEPAKPPSALLVRLFVALLLIVALTIVGRLLLPRVGLTLPLWVPVLAYAAIALSTLLVAWQIRSDDESGEASDEPPEEAPDERAKKHRRW